VLKCLSASPGRMFSVTELAEATSAGDRHDLVFRVCQHLAANRRLKGQSSHRPAEARFGV
jgi:hypothetical protein